MRNINERSVDVETIITKNTNDLKEDKEQKFLNLLVEIIVSVTLKEFYEEGDKILEI